MDSPAQCLEGGEHFPNGDEGVIHIGPLELTYPHIFCHAEYEFTSLVLRCFECRVVADLVFLYRLLAGVDWCLLIVIDQCVINSGLAWWG